MMQCQVPPGVAPGTVLQLQSPSGQLIHVQVPVGAVPGTVLQVPVSVPPGANAGMKIQVHLPTGPQLLHIAIPTGLFTTGGPSKFRPQSALQALENLEAMNANLQQMQMVSKFGADGFTPFKARTWKAKPIKQTCLKCLEYSQIINANVVALAQGMGVDVAAQMTPIVVKTWGFVETKNERGLLKNLEIINTNLLLISPSFCTAGMILTPCSEDFQKSLKKFISMTKFVNWIMEDLEVINGNLLKMTQCNVMNSELTIRIETREPAVFPECCVIL